MNETKDWFSLTFRNTTSGEMRDVRFYIEQHELAQKWSGFLDDILKTDAHLEKNYLLHGWLSGPRNLEFLCAELNRHIEVVNSFFSSRPKGLHYFIKLKFDAKTVDQVALNLIHHDFEILIGQVWNVSKYYDVAPPDVRHSIRQLNNLCHECEAFLRAQKALQKGHCGSAIICSIYPRSRVALSEEAKKGFQLFFNFGDVRLHYAQLGKTHLEAFYAKDEVVHDNNITELRYLTGEFDICLNNDIFPEHHSRIEKAFKDWLSEKSLDPDGCYGFPVVAKLDRAQFLSPEPPHILKELFNFDDICRITLSKGGDLRSKDFPYLWSDKRIDETQIGILAGYKRLRFFSSKVRERFAQVRRYVRATLD